MRGSDHDFGSCNWYKKSVTNNGAVYFEDKTRSTKPICNNIHCGKNEGTPRNIQAEGKT